MNKTKEVNWTTIIKPSRSHLKLDLAAIWSYRDLIFLFVRRDIVSIYKQTILGPLWILLQPLFTSLTFTLIFGKLAGFSTGDRPAILFYLSGVVIWTFFSETVTKTSNTFVQNANLFGKVYFPRIVMPLSVTIGNAVNFFIQLLFFLAVYFYFFIKFGSNYFNIYLLLLPVLLLTIGALALGMGIIISSLTTKYRDLRFIITFGIQLLMYLSPVIYDLSSVGGDFAFWLKLNPITAVIENFRFVFLGIGSWDWCGILYSMSFSIVMLVLGLMIFNKVEKNFLDTV